MRFASLIKWIDREWDDYPAKAASALGLLVAAALLPLMLIGWNPVTVALAAIWCLSWTSLFVWRGWAWLVRLENRQRRNRQRRRR